MSLILVPSLLASLVMAQDVDTTLAVRQGQRLELAPHSGSITVRVWNREAVSIRTSDDGRLEIDADAATIRVDAGDFHNPEIAMDYEITAPPWLALSLGGVNTDITVTGIRAPIAVETVQGDIDVRGGERFVTLHSVEGEVSLRDATGRIKVGSVNADVTVANAAGQIVAEAVNGDILLSDVRSDDVDASTVNGDISYAGAVEPNGRYRLGTHNGDVGLAMSPDADATVYVSTFSGEFESSFPVTLTETRRGRRFSFTLGSGAARVELESFQGDIQLVRPGELVTDINDE